MKFYPTKIKKTFILFVLFSVAINLGCSKDADLLLDSVINDAVVAVEEKEKDETTTPTEEVVSNEEVVVTEEPEQTQLESRASSFSPSNDAHVQSGKGYNQSIIRLGEENRTSYLMFDLSPIATINGILTKATLQFTIDSDDGNGNINVFKANSSDWSEHNLAENNIPQIETLIGSLVKEYKLGDTQFIDLDVSSLPTDISTLILSLENGDDLAFASKEHVSKIGPKLVVTYEVIPGSAAVIVPEITEDEITEDENQEEEYQEEETITNQEPIAIADATPSTGQLPLVVSFTGSNSSDDTSIQSYRWDFKDGTTASEANPTHTFSAIGIYEVMLTVTDNEGVTSQEVVTITVNEDPNEGPTARASATPITGVAPLDVVFKGSTSTDDVSIVKYEWDFKDGQNGDAADLSHTYTAPGNYLAILTVTDENGLSDQASVSITVTEPVNEAPVAKTSASTTAGVAPLNVQFTGTNSSDDNAITSYSWNFKDGTNASDANPAHTFTAAGTYVVELTVSDAAGLTHANTITIRVTEPVAENAAPIARTAANTTAGEAPLAVQFTGSQSTDDKAITSYFWDFKDGATSTNSNPAHTFTQAGSYVVALTVTDAEGESNTNTITINASAPVVNTPAGFYVATNGNSSNSGTSPSSPWSIEHAFFTADAGDIIYVKAGDYGNKQLLSTNNGSSSNPIKYIGYQNTPGDVDSNQGSTFNFGETVDSSKMPLLRSSSGVGTALTLHDANIEIENFQITGYEVGVQTIAAATNVKFKNIIITKVGSQNSDVYKGFGFDIKGNYSTIENCLVYNAGAEAFKLSGASNSLISYCKAYSDNYSNPTDYYFLITGGTNNSIVEHSLADRVQEISHPGHGFILKDLAENNTIRNCIVKNTKLEMNFSGVKNNVIDNCTVIGRGTSSADWEAAVVIKNGANNNVIKNTSISNANWAINLADDDDGYVGPGGDRDAVSLGYNNTFENITINNVYQMLKIGGGDQFSAKASDYTFKNCSLQNFEVVAVTYYRTENFLFQNCTFSNGNRLVIEFDGQYEPYSAFDVTWQNCQWSNVNFNPPN